MAISSKYGTVITERGSIGPDEPIFIIRAADRLALPLLDYYLGICAQAACPEDHLQAVGAAADQIDGWQQAHQDQVKTPG